MPPTKISTDRDDPLNPPPPPPLNLDERRAKFVDFLERWALRVSFDTTPDWRQVLTQVAVVAMDEDGSHTAELREVRRFARMVGWSAVVGTIAECMQLDEHARAKARGR
jgi:hypothetical protein